MKDFRPGTWKNPESAAHKGFNVHGTRPRRKKRRRQETARFIKAVPDFQLESEDVLRRPRTGAHLNFNEDTESESKSRTWRWTPKLVLAVMEILSGTRTVVQTLRKTPGLVFGVEARNRVPPVIGAATFWFINGNQCGQKIFMPPIGADCFFFFLSLPALTETLFDSRRLPTDKFDFRHYIWRFQFRDEYIWSNALLLPYPILEICYWCSR